MSKHAIGMDALCAKSSAGNASGYLTDCVKRGEKLIVIGGYDLNVNTRQLNTIKQMTVGVGKSLLKGAQNVIDGAITAAEKHIKLADAFTMMPALGILTKIADMAQNGTNLPGGTARKNCLDHLKWHEDALNKAGAANTMYASSDDLKKWVLQAFIEANAVEEGSGTLQDAWDTMWADVQNNIAALPSEIRQAVNDASGKGIEWLTGYPLWVWGVGGAVVLGVVGYAGYKILLAASPVIASGYLPRGRF